MGQKILLVLVEHGDSEEPDILQFYALVDKRVALHDVEELKFHCIGLPEKENNVFWRGSSLCHSRCPNLWDPASVLLQAKSQWVALCFTDTVVELKDFHSFVAFHFALDTVLVKGKVAVIYVLFSAQ